MSKAIKCDRCGKFEDVRYEKDKFKDTEVAYPVKPTFGIYSGSTYYDLCSECAEELNNWWLHPKLFAVQSVDPLVKDIDNYISGKNVDPMAKPPKTFKFEDNDDWKYSARFPDPLPDDTDEGLKLDTPEANEILKKEKKASKPGTDEKKPRSTTNIKWDDYTCDKLFGLFKDGKNQEQAAEYLGTTRAAVTSIVYKLKNARPGDNYYPIRRKHSWYFSKPDYKKWDNDSVIIVLEDLKRLGTVAAVAKENNITEASVWSVINRVKAAHNSPKHKYYSIYVQYADLLETPAEPKREHGTWTEERIKEALDLRTKNGHSWNTVAEIMGLTQKDIKTLTAGIAGNNGRIHRIAKEYGYGE